MSDDQIKALREREPVAWLAYDGSIPPKRTERCKQETGNHDNHH